MEYNNNHLGVEYTICVINLNMETTIERSLKSILNQIDNRFEVLVVDGGSSDNSLSILSKLQDEYEMLRVIKLTRDINRKKGADRDCSIRMARGKYVILHVDCDDVYENFLIDWVFCFHQIEWAAKKDVMVCGKQINMASRDLILKCGSYKNIEFEDRDLWMRMAALNRLVVLDHKKFVSRLPRTFKQKIYKNTIELYYGVRSDLLQGGSLFYLFCAYIKQMYSQSFKINAIKILLLLPVRFLTYSTDSLCNKHGYTPKSIGGYMSKSSRSVSMLTGLSAEYFARHFINPKSIDVFCNK